MCKFGMLFSHSAFGVYSKRAMAIMATRLFELLLDFRFHLALYFGCNLVAIFVLWLLCAQAVDPLPQQNLSDATVEAEIIERKSEKDNPAPPVQDVTSSGDLTPTVSKPKLRSIQPKVSFLDLRLTDLSNRSLQDSIWAKPSPSKDKDKTPTRNTYTQIKPKELRAEYKQSPPNDDLCSNQAVRYLEEPTLQEKMKSFERKTVGTLPCIDGAFEPPKNVRSRLRRHRSSPRLRHSVLTWWAGVEQQGASGELPRELDEAPEFEEHSDCSVCEIIHPWDSWSAAVHNLRAANDQDKSLKTSRIFANFDATPAPSTSKIH
ncbi:hypothetical protein F5887DRAFT_303300 [Amanita rubescens]|nr:hypothetical protein F5887DRAFT_303300 [Amanita rubescens]